MLELYMKDWVMIHKIRAMHDSGDVVPGFLEADLVAHCGGNTNGAFLNTLTLVDISTGWLECIPLLRKSARDVIDGLCVADDLLPFPLQGLDTDCGSEFINYEKTTTAIGAPG